MSLKIQKHKDNQILLYTKEVSTCCMWNVMFNMIFLALLNLVNYAVSNCRLVGVLDALASISGNEL